MFIPQHPTSIHDVEIAKALVIPEAAELSPDAAADVDLSLFICFSNRCGSNYLAELLEATGELPPATEGFNHPTVTSAAKQHQLTSFADYCKHFATHAAKKRRFACKVSAAQLFTLAQLGYLGTIFPRPHFIHIQRYDVIAQAISFLLAKSTRAFASYHAPQVAESDVAFDGDKLTIMIGNFDRSNATLRDFLLMNRLEHLPVLYEHLAAHPHVVLKHIFDWIGLDEPVLRRTRLRHERQVSSVKDEWYARYVAERS